MSCFKKVLLLLAIIGGINWGIYGIWGFNAVGWLLGGSMSWLSRTVFIIVGLSSLCLIPGLFMADPKTAEYKGGGGFCQWRGSLPHPLRREPPPRGGQESKQRVPHGHPLFFIKSAAFPACCGGCSCRR